MQCGNFRSLMASSSQISAEWEWRAQSQRATTPISPLPRSQQDHSHTSHTEGENPSVWSWALFFLSPTAMSHLHSTLRLLMDMKSPYLMDIKLCAQTAHKIFYFFFLVSCEYYLLHTVLIEESSSIWHGKQLLSILRSSENYFGLSFLQQEIPLRWCTQNRKPEKQQFLWKSVIFCHPSLRMNTQNGLFLFKKFSPGDDVPLKSHPHYRVLIYLPNLWLFAVSTENESEVPVNWLVPVAVEALQGNSTKNCCITQDMHPLRQQPTIIRFGSSSNRNMLRLGVFFNCSVEMQANATT